MDDSLRFSDLVCCPFCGGDEYFGVSYARGKVFCNVRFDGGEAHNEGMYDALTYSDSGRRRCSNCESYLGNQKKDEVGARAKIALKKRGVIDG